MDAYLELLACASAGYLVEATDRRRAHDLLFIAVVASLASTLGDAASSYAAWAVGILLALTVGRTR